MVQASSIFFLAISVVAVLASHGRIRAQGADLNLPEEVGYNRHVRPIMSSTCFQCHGPDAHARKGGRRLDTRDGALAAKDGVRAIVPGRPDESELIRRVAHADAGHRMPPPKSKKPALTDREVALLRRWIEQGAGYQGHWSFLPPVKPAVPRSGGDGLGAIDAFVMRRLHDASLQPSPPADRRSLIRRVSFDLTGLPPTPEEVDQFVRDRSPSAYESVVDRLLASPRFGERMAVGWLDAARYADTSAYHADGPRDMWAWRDVVVRSFNDNVPYDRFTIEQLAGDLIPGATSEQIVASAFNRNHCSSDEGGAFPEELRVGYVVDRVKTTSMVWLGLTMECSQCHSHKYDPISQRDYYSFYAFFNETSDPGMQTRNGNQKPTVDVLDDAKAKRIPATKARLEAKIRSLLAREVEQSSEFEEWLMRQPNAAREAPGGMSAHYPLDGDFVNVAAEAVDEPPRLRGDAAWVDAKIASGFRFKGKTFVDLGEQGDFERTDRFSVGAWIYPESKRHGAPIARMKDGNAHRGWDLYVGGDVGVSMHLIHSWPNDAIKVTTKKKLKAKKWQHVFITYDGSSKASGVKVYVDGEHWPTRPDRDSLRGTTRAKTPLYLGRRNPGSAFTGRVDDVRIYPRTLTAADVAQVAGQDPVAELLATPEAERTEKQIASVRRFYLANHDPAWQALERERTALEAEIRELETPLTTVMVMSSMKEPRQTFVLNRGAYDQPTKERVTPDVPDSLPPLGDLPANRLGLAKWLVDPKHPLTARVTVNRLWYQVFGRGLVETVEDFGAQGSYPSHPELLDWLAMDFVENGWDVKRLMRQLVLSSTYRQSAKVTPELLQRDPENVLLSRGPRSRLAAEFIRDMALQVSGLLVRDIGGPGVKPYQPPGLWNEVSLNKGVRFKQDHGDALYRRGLYTYWKRSAPPPAMRIFDAPTRERCVIRRPRTNTPLQALVTLNDPQFLEAARFLAQRMILEGGKGRKARINFAYRLVLSRAASADEFSVLQEALAPVLAKYRANPEQAEQLLAVGEKERDRSIDSAEHAAWMVLASLILNLDEALTK